jgi:hypothetical protein
MSTVVVPMRQALFDSEGFGRIMSGPSWAPWRAILLAARGEKLTAAEKTLAKKFTAREKLPIRPVRRLIARIGRRGAKTTACSVLAAYTATCLNHRDVLSLGERGAVLLLARNIEQARIAFSRMRAIFELPRYRDFVTRTLTDTIELKNNIDVIVRPNNGAGLRGLSIVACLCDEICHWEDAEHFVMPAEEILRAIVPGMLTTKGLLMLASTPWLPEGAFFDQYNAFLGDKGGDRALVITGTSADFNPTIEPEALEAERVIDPEAFASEYMVEWRKESANFITNELLQPLIPQGIVQRPYDPRTLYIGFADAAEGIAQSNGDSFACAVAHYDEDSRKTLLDAVLEIKPPFDANNAVAQAAALLREYRVGECYSDRVAAGFTTPAFAREGIILKTEDTKPTRDIFLSFLPLLTSQACALLDNPELIGQLRSLQRRPLPSGLERISAPPPLHDDLAVVCAGALTTVHEACAVSDWAAPVYRDGRRMPKADAFGEGVEEVKELMRWREMNPYGYLM